MAYWFLYKKIVSTKFDSYGLTLFLLLLKNDMLSKPLESNNEHGFLKTLLHSLVHLMDFIIICQLSLAHHLILIFLRSMQSLIPPNLALLSCSKDKHYISISMFDSYLNGRPGLATWHVEL